MRPGFVVYLNSDPTNVVGLFFDQSIPSGLTGEQAANAFGAALPGSPAFDVKRVEIDDYQLVNTTDVNLS